MTVVDGKEPDIASHLSVGLAVMVHVAPNRNDSPRFKTYLRGWQHGSYIILDVPTELETALPVRSQQCVVMRFMSHGAACGCLTTVLDMGAGKQMQYIRVAWPENVRVIALRRQERAVTRVPCTVGIEGRQPFEAELVDVSTGGCRLTLRDELTGGTKVKLSFILPDGTEIENAGAVVQSAMSDPSGFQHGCKWETVNELQESDIAFFVATSLSDLRHAKEKFQAVLFIDSEPNDSASLRERLAEIGIERILALDSIDGIYRLRRANPRAVFIGLDHPHVDAAALCGLIRDSERFKSTPVYVFGGGSDGERQANEAGATGYLPSLADVEGVMTLLEKHLTIAEKVQTPAAADETVADSDKSGGEAAETSSSEAVKEPEEPAAPAADSTEPAEKDT